MHHFKMKCQNESRRVFIMTRTMAGYVVELNGSDGLTPRSLVVTTDLLVVAFSDNLSAENSKLSADSGI